MSSTHINTCAGEHIYAYVYICIYMLIYIYIYLYIHAHTYIHTYIYTPIYIYSDTYMQTHVQNVCVRRMLCQTLWIPLQSTKCIYCIRYSDMVSLLLLLPYISALISLCHQTIFIIYYLKIICSYKGFRGPPMIQNQYREIYS